MDPLLVDIGLTVASLALFGAAYGGALLATRPARPRPAPATPDLGEEPPAMVNLLTNRWRLNEDAAESTLLDLAARRVIELRQPGNDPMQTTIHLQSAPSVRLRPTPHQPLRDDAEPATLSPYGRRVLDRIRGLAVDGVLPVTALTFRNERQATVWNRRLHREVVADARTRGLSRRRFGSATISALLTVAAVSAGGLFLATLRYVLRNPSENNDVRAAFAVGAMAFVAFAAIVRSQRDAQRDTAAGREVAARWLGVRDWLRGHEEFADLPPAAVTAWDRYLPYGAALGVTHAASAVLDLGMGDRRLVWSSYGGGWRRVRVRYPRFWSRYGRTVPSLLVPALLTMVGGALLVRYHQVPAEVGRFADDTLDPGLDLAGRIVLLLGILLLTRGGYRIVRALVDLATTRTVTGEVLWLQVWRTRSQGRNRPSVPWLHYLAVDDGHADRTVAWGLPHGTSGPRCHDGDTVTIRVRPWSRRVVELTLVRRGRAYHLADVPDTGDPTADTDDPTAAAGDPTAAAGAARGVLGRAVATARGQAAVTALEQPRLDADALLTATEVGRALGLAVQPPKTLPVPGPLATTAFSTADRGRQVLLVQVAAGAPGRWTWRANRRGTELPGIGDGAYLAGDRAALRAGDTTVLLTLMRDARGRHTHLPWLLHQVAARLPHRTGPGGPRHAGSDPAGPDGPA